MKWLLSAAMLLFMLYVGAAFALYRLQRQFIYHPTPMIDHAFSDRNIEAPDGALLKVIVVNEGLADALIYFGGNAESVAATIPEFADQLQNHALYFVNYRGYGGSTGDPTEAQLFSDATLIYDKVSAQHNSVSALGRSLGSAVACWLATQRELARLILVTPFDSIMRLAQSQYPVFPVKWLLKDRFESAAYAPQIDIPVLVIRATNDSIVPAVSSLRLIAAFNHPVRDLMLAAAGHNNIQNSQRYYPAIKTFLQQDAH